MIRWTGRAQEEKRQDEERQGLLQQKYANEQLQQKETNFRNALLGRSASLGNHGANNASLGSTKALLGHSASLGRLRQSCLAPNPKPHTSNPNPNPKNLAPSPKP